mgnify:CR=1 FL=1
MANKLLDEACLILDVKEIPPLYLINDPSMQALAIGASKPFIGITYALVERLNSDELLFVIAHELGHIKSGHVLYYNIALYLKPIVEVASQLSLGIAGLVGGGFQILRGSTVIQAPDPVQHYYSYLASNVNVYFIHNTHMIDTPSTTSATTYKTQMRVVLAGSSREIEAQPEGSSGNGLSTITLMEVAA